MKNKAKQKRASGKVAQEESLADIKNPLVRAFASRVKRWRQEKGLTLKDVAVELGLSVSIVCEWEHGNRFPSVDHLLDLSRHMGVPAWTLLCELDKAGAKKTSRPKA